jgi:hypothetical protein
MHAEHFLLNLLPLAVADMHSTASLFGKPRFHGAIGEVRPAVVVDEIGADATCGPLTVTELDTGGAKAKANAIGAAS